MSYELLEFQAGMGNEGSFDLPNCYQLSVICYQIRYREMTDAFFQFPA